jgi:membrane associated rhomboid family serine protease
MTRWVGLIIIANIAAFVWRLQFPEQAAALTLVPVLILQQPWTVLTSMFLHADFGHILFNMLSLYFFGPRVEDRLGGRRFLVLYFASGLAGALVSVVATPRAHLLGASAAIFGVLLAFARFWPRAQVLIWGIVPVEARTLIVIMTALSLLGGVGVARGNIAHFAHLGGFLGGWVVLRLYGIRGSAAGVRPIQTSRASPPPPPAAAERWKRISLDRLHPVNREEAERVLAKLEAVGAASLTVEERAFLDRISAI